MSELGALNPDDKKKLDETIRTGLSQLQQIEDIRESLGDLTKKVAEELGIKPKALNMAIRYAFKSQLADKKDELSTVEDILDVTGFA